MEKRFFLLMALVLLVGFVTRAFAQDAATPISRAGAVALMVESDPALKQRLQHHIKHPSPMPLFQDLDYKQWYAPYIETAFEAGLVTGNADTRFRPSDLLTDEESIVLMNRFYAMKNPGTALVTIQPGEDWFTAVINQASQNGLTLPSPIRLGAPASRSSIFAMMRSSGVNEPEKLAVTYRPTPAPVVVAQAPRPVVQQNRPAQQPVIRPITTTPRPVVAPVQQRPAQQQVSRPTIVAQANTTTTNANAVAPAKRGFSISLPTLGISSLNVIHPSDPTTKDGLLAPLKNGVGHLFSYPGGGGTILIYGHSSSYAWDVSNYTKIFRQINKLAVGEKITVNYNGKTYTYQVTHKQSVPANDLSAYKGGNGEKLILYTCWPPDSIKERYLVHAVPVSEVAAR